MENIGQSRYRNKEFKEKFNRGRLLQNVTEKNDPIIFDIGAHHGESVVYFKKYFPAATIFSFEPDSDSFSILSSKDINRVSYFNLALSNKDGTESFYRNKISHTNSLLKVNLSGKDSIAITKAIAEKDVQYLESFNDEVHVDTSRLDSFIKDQSINQIDILKIDVQGAECKVLAGGLTALSDTRVIVMEISFFDYYEHQTTFLDVEKILVPLGFRLFNISEISNNPMNGRTDWVEVLYLNENMPKR